MRSVPAGRLWAIAAMAVVGLGMMAVALAPLGPGARALTNCDVTAEEIALDGPEQELLRLLNEYRVANGIAPLAVSPNLNRAAAWYAKDMDEKQYFNMNHTDSLGRTPTQRFPDCGYPFGTRGENILGGTANPQVAFDLWKGSPGHNAAMLKTTFHAVGIGKSGIYWVMDFGGTDDSGEPTPTSLPTNTPTSTATSTPYVAPTATPWGQATNTPTPTPTLTPTATATPAPTMESADLPYGVSVPGVRR